MKSFNTTYEHDCDCIDICRNLDGVYGICEAGADFLTSKRCSPAEKNQIFLLNKISEKLDKLTSDEHNSQD